MIFTTYWFFIFASIFIGLFWLIKNPNFRLFIIITASLIFYWHIAGVVGMAPIILMACITYLLGIWGKKRGIIAGIIICIAGLLYYKYSVFFMESLLASFGVSSLNLSKNEWAPIAVPLAISFFTFEFVHYLAEIYMGRPPIRKISEFVAFATFFPSLAAGPIKRYEGFIESFRDSLNENDLQNLYKGFFRMLIGFFKKLVIADNLTAWLSFVDSQNPTFESMPYELRLWVVVAIAMRIYFDFSGYSDIAIGIAQMIGIKLPENFNFPYFAKNIQDFWQRWHISLSSWVRDYIYIPLGGNRIAVPLIVINGLIAFAIIGLWHGAAWNFIIWGLYHGVGLGIYNLYSRYNFGIGRFLHLLFNKIPFLSIVVTQVFVWIGWLIFFYPINVFTKNILALIPKLPFLK